MSNSTVKVIVHNSGTVKSNIIGCGYISIKDLLNQNRGTIIYMLLVIILM